MQRKPNKTPVAPPVSRKRKIPDSRVVDIPENKRSARLLKRLEPTGVKSPRFVTVSLDDVAVVGNSRSSTTASRRTFKAGLERVSSDSSLPDLLDGESMSSKSRNPRSPISPFKYTQSPGIGGFGGTPLFLGKETHFQNTTVGHSVSRSIMQTLLPPSFDLLKLILSVSSHRTDRKGLLASWMGALELTSLRGRVQLLVGLGYIVLSGQGMGVVNLASCPLTWQDIVFLKKTKAVFESLGEEANEIVYLISTVMEEVLRKDLSLKFRLENVLDFNDQITSRGWLDGGRDSVGSHSDELRIWLKERCNSLGVTLESSTASDSSPRHTGMRPQGERNSKPRVSADVFSHTSVDRVFGHWEGQHISNDLVEPVTPRKRQLNSEDAESAIREIIVVDVQTDHALRRHINKAVELRKEFPSERDYVQELRKFIHRRVHFETPETKGSIFRMAKSRQGFVHIGEVKAGASSRHLAILFKTLCDATGVYCRLVRDPQDVYYNIVMISELNGFDNAGNQVQKESSSGVNGTGSAGRGENSGSEDDDESDSDELDDAPEELIPVFWKSEAQQAKKMALSHPLDSLLQKCNSAADAIDLDEYFVFDCLIGKGSFGEVWKVNLKPRISKKKSSEESVLIPGRVSTGPFALKLISSQEADKEEASFMRIYSHARVINVIAVFRGYQALENRKREVEKKPAMCILMEMAEKCLETVLTGSFVGDIQSPRATTQPFKQLDLRFVFRILLDSARAMAFLHSPFGQRPHLVHRDLKPGNVLISADSRAIVTDFGVARMNPSLETNLTVGAGTEGYMAPEQKTLLYDRPADVYSFGVIIARILGVQNWKESSLLSLEDFDKFSADPVLVQLCLKCVQASPLHRPSFDQIHQVLMCEFLRREIARQILQSGDARFAKLSKSDSKGPGQTISHSSSRSPVHELCAKKLDARSKGVFKKKSRK